VSCATTAWLGTRFVIVRVRGESMLPCLHEGDVLLVDRRGGAWARGDLVVFRNEGDLVVKRIIGVGQDEVIAWAGRMWVNGLLEEQQYLGVQHNVVGFRALLGDRSYIIQSGRETVGPTGEWTVPAHTLFVVGDNRTSSVDSRSGTVAREEHVVGRPVFVLYPTGACAISS
jgi:signal peptidase I